jgi:predicted transposase YbfD/YdcC
LFTVKNNHKAKKKEIAKQFSIHNPECYTIIDKKRGRIEKRELQVMDVPEHLKQWHGVEQLLKITRTRTVKNKTTVQIAYGITSISKNKANSKKIMELWRNHWHIENRLHWVRDVVFNEDKSTIRKGSSPQIMAALRNLVISLAHKTHKTVTNLRFECARFHKRSIKLILEN